MTRQHPLRGRIPAMRGPCSALRVATIRYGDYVEQLTYLLFGYGITSRSARYEPAPQQAETSACCLKMADECSQPPYSQPSPVPAWPLFQWFMFLPNCSPKVCIINEI
jgi:hypothetical protein